MRQELAISARAARHPRGAVRGLQRKTPPSTAPGVSPASVEIALKQPGAIPSVVLLKAFSRILPEGVFQRRGPELHMLVKEALDRLKNPRVPVSTTIADVLKKARALKN
jgi:hypothetical protein